MFSLRTVVLPLALGFAVVASGQAPATTQAPATSDSSSSSASQAQADKNQQANTSVSARIKQRKEQRRAAAMHDAYSHLYDAAVGMGYERFILSNGLERATEYSWDTAFTRYYSEKLGFVLDGRGNYGSAFVPPTGNPQQNIFHPKIYQYALMVGPTYRFYATPRYSISGRVMAGGTQGRFSGDFAGNQNASTAEGLYSDGYTYALNAAIVGEYNLSPNLAARLAGEFTPTGFNSSIQSNRGFTMSLVYRFGKQ